jgi:hypothetical protein
MINDKAQPIQFYPDELITGMWRHWSEDILFKIPGTDFHSSTGFQKLIGSTGAHERSRATEAYRLGLLKGRLVQGREAAARGLPAGWSAVCIGESAHTHLGYIAYAIGKALSKDCAGPPLGDALNVLHFVFALSLGIEHERRNFSVLLLYEYALCSYRRAIDPTLYKAREDAIKRWVAAAVFDTLDSPDDCTLVTQKYIDGIAIDKLFLRHKVDQVVTEMYLTPKILTKVLSDNELKISYHKAALYWEDSERGIYSRSTQVGGAFLGKLLIADQKSFSTKKISILSSALEADPGKHSVLESMLRAFEVNADLAFTWKEMMKKLTKGVYEALRYLEDGTPETTSKVFYVHGVDSSFDPSANTIRVLKEQTPIKPGEGSMFKVGNASFTLKEIKESAGHYEFTLGPNAEGQSA